MLAMQISVLMPGECDDHDIYGGDHQEPDGMRKAKAVHLTGDEQAEDDDCRGIVPKFLTCAFARVRLAAARDDSRDAAQIRKPVINNRRWSVKGPC